MNEVLINRNVVLESPALVLFDKDGTLIDIHHYWASMIRIRSVFIVQRWFAGSDNPEEIELSLISAMGVDLATGHMKPEGPVGVKPRPYIVNVAAMTVRSHDCDITNEEMEELFAEVDQQTAKNLRPLLKLLPGVEELLQRLLNCGVSAAVVSTDITSRTRQAMETLGIAHYFKAIIGGDSVKNTKPAPDLAELVINDLNMSPEKVVVIGDHPVDIKMGMGAGAGLNIGVLTGLSERGAFAGLECSIVCDLRDIDVRCKDVD